MARTASVLFAGFVSILAVAGCSQRALVVEHVPSYATNVTGQSFCLAKGIISLTVSNKPPRQRKGAMTDSLLGPTFSSLSRLGASNGFDAIKKAARNSQKHNGGYAKTSYKSRGNSPASSAASVGTPAGITSQSEHLKLIIGRVRYLPDCDYHYTVSLKHDVFHNDDIKISIDPITKLLSGINSTLEDKTPEIFRKIAEAPAEILKGYSASGQRIFVDEETKYFEINHDVDPTDRYSVAAFNMHLRKLSPRVKLITRPLIALPNAGREKAECGNDICFRTAMPYIVELATAGGEERRVIAQQVVVLPNPYLVANIPVTRAPFVKKEVNLKFKDGMLIETHIKNPSEVLAFLDIPISVAKALVAIPSAMFKFEVIQTQNDAGRLRAQKDGLILQKEIIEAQRALLAAAAAPQ